MLTIIGICLILFGWANLLVINLRKFWPEVTAKVLVATVAAMTPDDIDCYGDLGGLELNMSLGKTHKCHDIFEPTLIYKYTVDGKSYASTNMYSGVFSKLDTGIIRFFTAGNHYPVRYNPQNPNESYLMFSPIWPYILTVAFGGAILFFGVMFEVGFSF